MLRTLLASVLLLFLCAAASAQALFGTVIDETGEPVIGATVGVFNGESLVTGTTTDYDGNYRINLDPGTYGVQFSYIGYPTQRLEGVTVVNGTEKLLDFAFEEAGVQLTDIIVTEYRNPVMSVDETTQGATITSDEVKRLGSRSINAIAGISAGATSSDEGAAVSIRGARTDATQYIIDGIRVTGALIPETEIDQIQVVTGGVEAKYGDLSGGIISITTKGPSSEFRAYAEAESSRYLDDFDNNLVGLNFSGPLLKRTLGDGTEQSVIGYRFSGRYTYQENNDPPATPVYYVTDEARERLERNPIERVGESIIHRAAFLEDSDVQTLAAKPFEALDQIDVTGKIDARFNSAMDVTFSGNYRRRNDQFTPFGWRLLNAHNNPFDLDETYRGNLRFRHRLGNNTPIEEGPRNLISNALYTVQVGFQRSTSLEEDPRHEDRFWDYGHVGSFEYEQVPTFDYEFQGFDSLGNVLVDVSQNDYLSDFRGFTPSTRNPVLARYNLLGAETEDYSEIDPTDFLVENGVQSSLVGDGVYDFHTSIGQVYNRYAKSQNDLITLNLQSQFDFQPSGSSNGNHNIQLGVLYEQRINRFYGLAPRALWRLGGQLANQRLSGLDTNAAPIRFEIIDTVGFGFRIQDTVPIYPFATTEGARDARFAKAIRQLTGQAESEFVNLQNLDPSLLDLSLFSADELASDGLVNYYGYDYLGNAVGTTGAWEDFFRERDPETGERTFPVAPIQPIYASGYLQDKFTFRNIILRAGVRLDYFDANTKVLRDPYELYDIQTAEDFHAREEVTSVAPANIPADAKVYVQSEGSTEVQAYRLDDTWYTGDGRQVNRAAEIFTTQQIPAYVDPRATSVNNYIQSEEYDPNASFRDYEAQINVMPRLAFSFPISEQANFFAHYDVLVQRPAGQTVATAADYFYFANRANGVFNNPNLRPTKTVDYEAGFQTRVSAASALKLSFFVREMRDMIQRRTYQFAVGNLGSYQTYDNQDFGTVKGLNVSYDLRRTGPVQMRISYALQFADGTGSDVNSQRGNASRGNLRTLYPLSFDERHRISGSIDYRYGAGEGPEIFGKRVFANTGVNLFGSTVSGRPYTRRQTPTQFGGRVNEGDINGARLPWNVALNLRVDRDFLVFPEARDNNGMNLNVYLRISNLLDRRNIIAVYSASGKADDDGFLQSPLGQRTLQNQIDQEAYTRLYNYRLLNPDFFSLPRRIFLGASIAF